MKKFLMFVVIIVLLLLIGLYCARNLDVTHAEIKDTVVNESVVIQECLEAHCQDLEQKLECIESKLDKLLEMATAPMMDEMKRAY